MEIHRRRKSVTIHELTTYKADCAICDAAFDDEGGRITVHSDRELVETLKSLGWYGSRSLGVAVCPSCRNGSLLPLACQCIASSRFHATSQSLECDYRESGGVRCEVLGVHDRHAWGSHTIEHSRWGNGYHCSSVDERI
jgi:hypothetical protein